MWMHPERHRGETIQAVLVSARPSVTICSFQELEQLGSEGGASSPQLQLSGTHCHFTFAPRPSVAVSFEQASRLIFSGCSLSLTYPLRTIEEIELRPCSKTCCIQITTPVMYDIHYFSLIFSCCWITLMFHKMFILSLACCICRLCWIDWRRIRKWLQTRKPSSLTWVKLHSYFVYSYTGSEPAVQKIAGIDQVIYNLWHVMNNRKLPLWQNCIFPNICVQQVSLKLFNKYWIVQKRSIFECRGIWIQTLSHP